jgi:acyl-[acyl carrier protein]--UDP-N-acetylglucosamine O-acyltransferase
VNTVGLRRAGLKAEAIASLRQALKLLLQPAVPLARALEELDRIKTPEVAELAAFVRASTRGFAHAPAGAAESQE